MCKLCSEISVICFGAWLSFPASFFHALNFAIHTVVLDVYVGSFIISQGSFLQCLVGE